MVNNCLAYTKGILRVYDWQGDVLFRKTLQRYYKNRFFVVQLRQSLLSLSNYVPYAFFTEVELLACHGVGYHDR